MYLEGRLKNCSSCKKEKLISEFDREHLATCSDCLTRNRINGKRFYEKRKKENPGWMKSKHQKPRTRFSHARSHAKLRGIDFSLSYEDFYRLISSPCHYCNDYFNERVLIGSGIDRMNNSIGYIKGNCVPCCKRCNVVKGQFFSVEQTEVMIRALIEYEKRRIAS